MNASNHIIQGENVFLGSPVPTNMPVAWKHGIRGQGEVVGIADTGIDHDGCFFNDPASRLPTCATVAGSGIWPQGKSITGCMNATHRKIVAYRYFTGSSDGSRDSDLTDSRFGHGTHVAGNLSK